MPRNMSFSHTTEQIMSKQKTVTNLTYLACPYSHKNCSVRGARFTIVNRKAAELMRAGAMVFSPISHTHPIVEHGLPKGWNFWSTYDRIYLEMCKAMVVLTLDGWIESKGVQAEIKIMQSLARPIFYLRHDEAVGDIAQRLRGL